MEQIFGVTYKKSGVDIGAGESAVIDIKKSVRSTYNDLVMTDVGTFGALFQFPSSIYEEPVLVSSTDGVGTKTLIAEMVGRYDSIGHDLVNHCVNDILTTGARPLFFLDYLGVGRLKRSVIMEIVDGLASGCRLCDCALVGGEMAEMPEIYGSKNIDIVGTIVGVVEKANIIDGKKIAIGDILIGLSSTGLHTNGYTLARKVLLENFRLDEYIDAFGCTVGEELLKVHKVYLEEIQEVLSRHTIKGLAHVTGGGITGNTRRILPEGTSPEIDWSAWEPQPVFSLIQRLGDVPVEDMRRTFNLGVGFVVISSKEDADNILFDLTERRSQAVIIGEIV